MLYKIYIYTFFGCAGTLLLLRLFSSCSECGLVPSGAQASRHGRFLARQLGSWAPGFADSSSRAEAQELWCMGLAALGFVESSQTRDGTPMSCIDR